MRVVGEEGEQLGVMPIGEARRLADEAGVDLVKIAPNAKPPVCKLVDYGKFKYEQTRKEKEAKKKQKTVEIKEIRLSLNIDTHDFETKLGHAEKFLGAGNKVKVSIRFRGREMAHTNLGADVMRRFAEALQNGTVEKEPKMEGRSMSMFVTPSAQK